VNRRRWTIGQLAKASGVTVRMLHHYDRIGLVSPKERTGAGHRRYGEADVRRLYRVRALFGLGLSLAEVAVALAESGEDRTTLRELLRAQLANLRAQADRAEERATRVRALLAQLDGPDMPPPEQFLSTVEPLTTEPAPAVIVRASAGAATLDTTAAEPAKAE
jgi:DNA-binding transcriptional MerR regulator